MGGLAEPLNPCCQTSAATAHQLGFLQALLLCRQTHCCCGRRAALTKEDQWSLQPYTNSLYSGFRPALLSLFNHISPTWVTSLSLSEEGVTSHYHLFPMVRSPFSFGVHTSHIFTGLYSIPVRHLNEQLPEGRIQKKSSHCLPFLPTQCLASPLLLALWHLSSFHP